MLQCGCDVEKEHTASPDLPIILMEPKTPSAPLLPWLSWSILAGTSTLCWWRWDVGLDGHYLAVRLLVENCFCAVRTETGTDPILQHVNALCCSLVSFATMEYPKLDCL